MDLQPAARERLLELAAQAIRCATGDVPAPAIVTAEEPAPLREPGASFVTLKRDQQLRGCIGTLEAHRPLAVDVLHNAEAAALHDPRFEPLRAQELIGLTYSVTLLTPSQPLHAPSRDSLLEQLEPHRDGLIITARGRRATFLPAVWEQLPDPETFLDALLRKAGLPSHIWPQGLQAWRYASVEFAGGL